MSVVARLYRHLIPRVFPNSAMHRQMLADRLNTVSLGGLDCTMSVTLTPNANFTLIPDPRIGLHSYVGFMATTANAIATKQTDGLFVCVCTAGQINIEHANNAQTDRTFTMCMIG